MISFQEEDSEPWFLAIKLHTISIGQSTHQDWVKKSGLQRILFDKSCLWRTFFHKNLACSECVPWAIFFLIILGCIWSEVSYSVYYFIVTENDSREAFKSSTCVDIIWVTQRDRDSGEQTTCIKQSLPQRYVRVGCQGKSDQELRLLSLKGHVRSRDSTLWRYRWQEGSEFLCTKLLLFGGRWAAKKSPKNPGNVLSDALLMSRFHNLAADAARKKTARFPKTCVVSINELNRLRPKILKSCFLHWYGTPSEPPFSGNLGHYGTLLHQVL